MNENKKRNPEYLLKMGFVALGLIVVVAIIIGSWVWNIIFDADNFNLSSWAESILFNGSISLATMVLGFIAINEQLKSKESGKYQKRKENFNDLVNGLYETNRIVFFDQFLSWYAERQVREKKIKHLTTNGMPRMDAEIIVDYACINDISTISGLKEGEKPQGNYGQDLVRKIGEDKEILIPAIRDNLAVYVEEVLNGTISVQVEDSSYYCTDTKNRDSNLTSLERAQATEKDRTRSLRTSFISKVVIGVVYVSIISLLVVDLNGEASSSEAIWKFVVRIASATLGFITGGMTGATNCSYLYKWLGDKMRVLNEYNKYYDTKEFIPRTYEETSKERIAKIHKAEEEAINNVVLMNEEDLVKNGNNMLLIDTAKGE